YLSLGQVPVDDREPDEDAYVVPEDDGLGLVVPDEEAVALRPTRAEAADGRQGALHGLAGELKMRIAGLAEEDPDDARIDRVTRDLDDLRDLQSFATPLIQEMAAWPVRARWGEWIGALGPFARRVLKQPERVLQVLESFHPMDDVGPVSL